MFLAETSGSPRYPAVQVAVPGNRYFNGPIQAGSAGLKIRLSYKGYGESRPIATNDTAEGRQQNRRVELTIIK